MQPWTANLLGLAVGFALGGAALAHFLPQLEAMYRPVAPPQAEERPPPAPPLPAVTTPTIPAPAPLPRIAGPGLPQPTDPDPVPPLPQIIHPDPPPARGVGTAGTGFFIAEDGTLLTAAHVVTDCRRTQVLSRLVRLSAAKILAEDQRNDLALLQVNNLRPPAVLPIGPPAQRGGRIFILGYPASANLRVPDETWGTLENGHFPPAAGRYGDPGFMIWMHAGAVTHGYSGGPILDPRNGEVVGLVRATVDGKGLRRVPGLPTQGMAIGPGSGRLIDFVRQQAPWLDVSQASAEGDDAIDLARRATVHVLCWRH